MSDDPDQIRAAAREARRLAHAARGVASALRRADGVEWQSNSAGLFRARLSDRAREVGRRADDLEDLARLLNRHARAIESHEAAVRADVDALTPWDGLVPG